MDQTGSGHEHTDGWSDPHEKSWPLGARGLGAGSRWSWSLQEYMRGLRAGRSRVPRLAMGWTIWEPGATLGLTL